MRIAARGIRLDVAWTDRAAHAKAWRESEAGAETTFGPDAAAAVFGTAGEPRTAASSGRRGVTKVGVASPVFCPPR